MRVVLLGTAAGGGFPQWNSNGPGCRRARAGDSFATPRTQTSVAVSADSKRWILLNASPDLRTQIEATPALWPRKELRSSPLVGVVLMGGDVDAIAGLLHLRERQPLKVWATGYVHDVLSRNAIFEVLAHDCVRREKLSLGVEIPLDAPDGTPTGLALEAFEVPGKVPLYRECEPAGSGHTIGVRVAQPGTSSEFHFIPGCASIEPALLERVRGTKLLLFEGTFWTDDEMIRQGVGAKTARRMGHLSVSGPDGILERFAGLPIAQRLFVHVNNTNPMLLEDSFERIQIREAGWDVGTDGMEIEL
jgi:pyrroloquinoline quinone biosynthesis protein B